MLDGTDVSEVVDEPHVPLTALIGIESACGENQGTDGIDGRAGSARSVSRDAPTAGQSEASVIPKGQEFWVDADEIRIADVERRHQ